MEQKQRTFSVWYAVLVMLVLFGIQAILLAPHPENVSYSGCKALVTAGKVSDLVLYKDTIEGTLSPTGLEGILNGPVAGERGYSEETARTIDQEIQQLLAGAHIRVRETLTAKRSILEALAKLLIEEEVVDRDTLTALLATPRA